MLEKINRNNININWDYVFVILIGSVVCLGLFLVFACATPTPTSPKQTTNQPSSASILIASWNANQTKLNNDILSDIKFTGSKLVNGTISSGTTITTTRADFLSHLSNKTVVYISPASKIVVRPVGVSMGTQIRLVNPLDYSVIVGGVTYSISVNDNRYSLMKLKNESFIDVIWINDNYWWG
jgi:hypothetical protein